LLAVMLPIESATNTGQGAFEGLSWSVTEQSTNKDAAIALLNFMINDEAAIKALQYVRGVSPSSKVRGIVEGGMSDEDKISSGSTYISQVMENPSASKPLDPAGASKVGPLLRKINEDISFGKSSVADATESFFQQAERILR
jgi:multiple sugar transport system substrate-binding protein